MPFRMLDIIANFAKLLTGAQGVWVGTLPSKTQRIYFANHTSNLDTIIIWSALPSNLRSITRPVAAKDYWDQKGIRRHIATKELNVVFVERNKETRSEDPLNPLRRALDEGYSLIIFPEGKRNPDVIPGEFKSGIARLHEEYPHIEMVPVYLENVAKTFPRGAFFPLPINCKAHFGKPLPVTISPIENNNDTKEKVSLEKSDNINELIAELIPEGKNNLLSKITETTNLENVNEQKEKANNFLNQARLALIDLIPEHTKWAVTNFDEKVKSGQRTNKE